IGVAKTFGAPHFISQSVAKLLRIGAELQDRDAKNPQRVEERAFVLAQWPISAHRKHLFQSPRSDAWPRARGRELARLAGLCGTCALSGLGARVGTRQCRFL